MSTKIEDWLKAANQNRPDIGEVISPSWLSGLVSVVAGVVLVLSAVALAHYNGSDIQLLRQNEELKQSSQINDDYQELDSQFSTSQLISDIPLLIFWGGVGLVAYNLTMHLAGAFKKATEFEQELNYVHADRNALIRSATTAAIFRVVALVLWLLYLEFTLHVLLPYIIALAYAGSGNLNLAIWQNVLYLLAAAVLMAITVHLHVVLLRLTMLRTRIFSQF